MDKLRMETKDMTQENIKKLAELFPNVVTEMKDEDGNLKKGINFELLKQELLGDVIDGEEAYDFTWVGKRAAMVEANTPIRKTLRPCPDESKNWETTENLYIEGDNLDALKLLQESYLNAVKVIYIDPPYNTGKDSFVYVDNYTMDAAEYEEGIEYRDEDGNINFRQNNAANPRFHSDWCSMMYPRLKLAKSLLAEDGVIFISIDDNEVHNLRKICDEVFGSPNFIVQFLKKGSGARQDSKHFAQVHEYVLCYARNPQVFVSGKLLMEVGAYPKYDRIKNRHYKTQLLRKWGENSRRQDRPNLFYPIPDPDGAEHYPMLGPTEEGCWRWGKEKMFAALKNGDVEFIKRDGVWVAYEKIYEPLPGEEPTKLHNTWIDNIKTNSGSPLLRSLFGGKVFDYPKPLDLIKLILQMGNVQSESIVLDIFAGSATTAHAVMELNAEDGGNRKFIMVQLPEEIDEQSDAFRAGHKTVADIGKERIRRAGEKIKAEVNEANARLKDGEKPKKVPDIGFRVFKVDSTNMKDVYYAANEITQEQLFDLESNIKEDRTDLDLLYGVMVDWGLPLSLNHETETIEDVNVHTVDHGSLVACFAESVPETVVREIAKRQPLRVVFRDSSFASSPEKISVEEIFKLLAPNTSIKVI